MSVLTRGARAAETAADPTVPALHAPDAASRGVRGAARRELVENLVLRDVKARYKQSLLGLAWAVFNPLVYAFIYTVVGKYFLKQDTRIPTPVFAYFGLLYWNLFATGLGGATESLVGHIGLITKVYFPREVFPVAAVLAKVVDFGFGLFGLVPLLLILKTAPDPVGALLALPLLLILLAFTIGVGLLTSCANLFYRDIRHLVGMSLNVLMFLWPNMYPLDRVPEAFRPLYLLNPVAAIIEAARRLTFPASGDVRPLLPYVAAAAVTAALTLTVGYTVFKRNEPRFAEFI